MADFLTENSLYYQSMTSSFGLMNFNGNLDNVATNANTESVFKLPDISSVQAKAGLGAVSSLNFEYTNANSTENIEESEAAEDVLKMLMETYQKINYSEDEDWRSMTDEEWEKLLAKIDNDIEAMQEYLEEEEEKARQEQLEEIAEEQLI